MDRFETDTNISGRPNGHTFHIPVMGTGFTIDTPLRVAKYGISSVISIVDDFLVEQMRKHHSERTGEPYVAIGSKEEDARARRITAYLNLVGRLVSRQVEKLQASPFEEGSEITRYFELLPDSSLKRAYKEMLATEDPASKERMQSRLRRLANPGSIDVNIMTKLDRDVYRAGKKLPPECWDAMSSLRGFAKSDLRSAIVFSAGMNQRLYAYAAEFEGFYPDERGAFSKRIILKVSDYRSAVIQGKFLAKKGLWISEFRIESGLNCGGHAFATKGHLMGPILEEFKEERERLLETLWNAYRQALEAREGSAVDSPPPVRITVQGGIGTAAEDRLLLKYYAVDGTGWATPFLLVPEVTNVDPEHLKRLSAAGEEDVYLSDSSPLGVPFWNLRISASEDDRRRRIEEGKPGSPCPKGYLVSNTEFTEAPICTASRAYQKKKLENLSSEGLSFEQKNAVEKYVLGKSCLCRDLSGGAEIRTGITPASTPAVCCGPNIVNFSRIATLEEMVGHIYGRLSLLTNADRPHMFVRELKIYIDHLRKQMEKYSLDLSSQTPKYFKEFKENLVNGIEYYLELADQLVEEKRERFLDDLQCLREELEKTLQAAFA